MAATQLFINVAASSIARSLVRSVTDLTPVPFPELVIGDGRSYELYFVDGLGGYAAFSGDGSYIPYIAIGNCGFPEGGTAIWTFSGQSTSPLAFNVSPAALQAALEALSNIGAGNVSVAGVAGKYYVITFQGTMGGMVQPEVTVDFDGLTPASTVDITTVVTGGTGVNAVQLATLAVNPLSFADDWAPITNGWTGQLSTRTVEVFEAFAAAGGTLSEIFQVTVANADGVRSTYAKVTASIQCTVINPESFAGADKPLLATQAALNAAVLGLGNFTRETLASAATGNTNVARPSTASRHHLAKLAISGAAGLRTVSLLTTNTPNPGDFIFLNVQPAAVAGYVVSVYNATTGGTLLTTFTTIASGIPYLLIFSWNGSSWENVSTTNQFLAKAENLASLADVVESKTNLRVLFSRISDKSADFNVVQADEGTLFRVDASAAPIAATLPAANTVPATLLIAIQKLDSGPQVVTTVPPTKTLASPGATMVIQSDGNDWRVVLAYDPAGITPTLSQVVENREDLDTLAGIRAEATAGGATATNSAWAVSAGTGGIWVLVDGTDADNGIDTLRPDDFNSSTNPRVWKLKMRGAPATLEEGDVLFFDGTDLVRLALGSAGQVLTVNEDADAPEWQAGSSPTDFQRFDFASPGVNDPLTPTTPITTAPIIITGTAGSNEINVEAPPPNPGFPPSFPVGWIIKMFVAMPATAGITLDINDDESGDTIQTLTSDDGGGSAFNVYLELAWDGAHWRLLFLISPTLGDFPT